MTAGSANATQFPIMVIAYGGVPFLLACFVFLVFVAFPAMRLESNLAQFVGDGNRGIFSTVPLFFGMGYTVTTYVVTHAVADTMALAEAFALLMSWTKSFDWHHNCPGGWMTRNFSCYAIRPGSTPCKLARDELTVTFRDDPATEGIPVASGSRVVLVPSEHYKDDAAGCIPDLADTAAPYHFRRQAIWEAGAYDFFRAEPVFAVAVIWLLVFAIAHKGFLKLKTFFYTIILLHVVTTFMLLARASTLTGAIWGLRLFLHANWSSVASPEMWSNALYVSLESVGVTGTIYLGIGRFNCFKNRLQEDVMFVLVADTASKGIGTVVSFLFLGYLSYATDINIHMLVRTDFNFVVSIPSQAVSLVPFPEFWSRIHSLWVVSMMLPKFLIVPDIIIEVLSASHPPMLVNRRSTHFSICFVLFCLSVPVVVSGGAKGVAVLSNSQNNLRLFLIALEFIVILQMYGARRLEIDSQLMTSEVPGPFVKFCWTSVIPLSLMVLLLAKALRPLVHDRQFPLFLTALIAWLQIVELSFIPVYALVFIMGTKLSIRDCLVPLPTWVPVRWEQAMQYRQQLAAEGLDAHDMQPPPEQQRSAQCVVPSPPPQEQMTQSSSDLLGTHLILTAEAQLSPSTSDWRYDSSEENKGEPPVKFRSPPEKLIPESGTFYKSRALSSLWRLVRSPKPTGDVASPPLPRKKGARRASKLRTVSRPKADAANKPAVAPVASVSHAVPGEKLAERPREEGAVNTPLRSPGVALAAATATHDNAAPGDSERERIGSPADAAVGKGLAESPSRTMDRESSPAVAVASTHNQEQVATTHAETSEELDKSAGREHQVLSEMRRLIDDDLVCEVGVAEPRLRSEEHDAAPLSLPSPQLSDLRPLRTVTTSSGKTESPSAILLQAPKDSGKDENGQRGLNERPVPADSPKPAKKWKIPTPPKKHGITSPHKSEHGTKKSTPPRETAGHKDVKSPGLAFSPEALQSPVKPARHKKHHGSPSKKTRKVLSPISSSPRMAKSSQKTSDENPSPDVVSPLATAKSAHTQKAAVSRKKAGEADLPSPAAIASPSPTRHEPGNKKQEKSYATLASDRNRPLDGGVPLPATEVISPSRKATQSPSRKAAHHRKRLDQAIDAASPKMVERKQPSKKTAVHLQTSAEVQSPAISPASQTGNAKRVALSSPQRKSKGTAATHKATAKEKTQRGAGKATAHDRSSPLALSTDAYGLEKSASIPIGSATSPPLSEYEEPDHGTDDHDVAPQPETGHSCPPQELKNTTTEGAVTTSQFPPDSPIPAASSVVKAEGPETGEMKLEQGKGRQPTTLTAQQNTCIVPPKTSDLQADHSDGTQD